MCSLSRSIFIAMALLTGVLGVAQTHNERIPTTHGTSFAGTAVNLPGDLRGKVGILVVGFSKSSGDVCKVWGQHLATTYENSHDAMYFQMPELESVPKLVRGMVLRSMKSSVPQWDQSHFMPIFSDEAVWKSVTRFGNPDDAYVLVVDGDGKVLWQTSGTFTDAGFSALKEQVEALRKSLGQ
jgi:ATP10 protein